MSHYNFKKITVVPGGKVISLSLYTDMTMCLRFIENGVICLSMWFACC